MARIAASMVEPGACLTNPCVAHCPRLPVSSVSSAFPPSYSYGRIAVEYASERKETLDIMKIYLVDGTYELFRSHFGAPPRKAPDGREVGATLGLLRSLLMLVTTPGITHVACAFDHVIESFRNGLYPGYKTGAGVDPNLLAQFSLAEEAVVRAWAGGLADGGVRGRRCPGQCDRPFQERAEVEQIVLCSPDKDLAQLVSGNRIVGWDRRRNMFIDEAGVVEKFGVRPQSIPDWLGLVGDAADGFPGIPGWGAKSAAAVLAQYERLEAIPADPHTWGLRHLG